MYEMCPVKAEWTSNYNGNHTVTTQFSRWQEGGKQKHKKEGFDFSSKKQPLFISVCHTSTKSEESSGISNKELKKKHYEMEQ